MNRCRASSVADSTRTAASSASTEPSCASRPATARRGRDRSERSPAPDRRGAVALVGTYQSDVTQNVSSVAERAGVPLVIDVAVDDAILEQGYKNTFRIQPNATNMGIDGGEALLAMAEQNEESIDRVSYIHVEAPSVRACTTRSPPSRRRTASTSRRSPTPVELQRRHHHRAAGRRRRPGRHPGDRLLPRQSACRPGRAAAGPRHPGLYGIANGAFDNSPFPNDAGKAGEVCSAPTTTTT